jgi:hypothetical protein
MEKIIKFLMGKMSKFAYKIAKIKITGKNTIQRKKLSNKSVLNLCPVFKKKKVFKKVKETNYKKLATQFIKFIDNAINKTKNTSKAITE